MFFTSIRNGSSIENDFGRGFEARRGLRLRILELRLKVFGLRNPVESNPFRGAGNVLHADDEPSRNADWESEEEEEEEEEEVMAVMADVKREDRKEVEFISTEAFTKRVGPFIHSIIHSFIHSIIHSFMQSINHSFIHES